MGICWADRVVAAWALIVFAILILAGSGGTHGAEPLYVFTHNANSGGLHALFILIGVPWLFLRGIDLLAGGPQRRANNSHR